MKDIQNLESLKNNIVLNKQIKDDIIKIIETFNIDKFTIKENLEDNYIYLTISSKESKSSNYSEKYNEIEALIKNKINDDDEFESIYNVCIDDNNSIELYF